MGSWDRLATNLTNQKWLLMIDSALTWILFLCYRTKWCPIWREQRHQNVWSSQHLIPISTMFCSKYTPCWLWTLSTNFSLFFRMWIFQHFLLLINHHLLVTASVQGNRMGNVLIPCFSTLCVISLFWRMHFFILGLFIVSQLSFQSRIKYPSNICK